MPSDAILFGVLNLHKPGGMTSRDLVNKVQRLVRPVKVGHAGTLDPMATGVLLVCVGPATRLVTMLQEGSKTYVAEFLLGQSSDTDDNTGQITHHSTPASLPTRGEIVECLQTMQGAISQVPPAFSAVHVNGRRAYSLAREGQEITLNAKDVVIHSIQVLTYEWPRLELEIVCGSGTYVRSIARDLGQKLGCGGLMSRLERTSIGDFSIAESVAFEELTSDNIGEFLFPAIRIVSNLAKFDCSPEQVKAMLCGKQLVGEFAPKPDKLPPTAGDLVALTRGEFTELLALAELTPEGRLQPRTVFLKHSEPNQGKDLSEP